MGRGVQSFLLRKGLTISPKSRMTRWPLLPASRYAKRSSICERFSWAPIFDTPATNSWWVIIPVPFASKDVWNIVDSFTFSVEMIRWNAIDIFLQRERILAGIVAVGPCGDGVSWGCRARKSAAILLAGDGRGGIASAGGGWPESSDELLRTRPPSRLNDNRGRAGTLNGSGASPGPSVRVRVPARKPFGGDGGRTSVSGVPGRAKLARAIGIVLRIGGIERGGIRGAFMIPARGDWLSAAGSGGIGRLPMGAPRTTGERAGGSGVGPPDPDRCVCGDSGPISSTECVDPSELPSLDWGGADSATLSGGKCGSSPIKGAARVATRLWVVALTSVVSKGSALDWLRLCLETRERRGSKTVSSFSKGSVLTSARRSGRGQLSVSSTSVSSVPPT
eukprot:m.390993 g.390993  ORF g.390993 m.390993 type:complete len:392 (-) comp28308_c0_seq2:2172-3347(-)